MFVFFPLIKLPLIYDFRCQTPRICLNASSGERVHCDTMAVKCEALLQMGREHYPQRFQMRGPSHLFLVY